MYSMSRLSSRITKDQGSNPESYNRGSTQFGLIRYARVAHSERVKMDDHPNQWHRYRVRQRWIVACLIFEFVAFIPFVGIVGLASKRLFPGSGLALPAAIWWGA